MKAFITGITGQDGYYLSKLLLEKGYEVHGTIRRNSSINTDRIDPLISQYGNDGQLKLHYSDLSDSTSLSSIDHEQMKEMLERDHANLVQRVNKYSIESMYDAVIEVIQYTFQKYSDQTDYQSRTRSRITLRANSQEAAELRFENGSFQYFDRSWGGPDEIIDFTTNAQVRDFLTRRSYLGIIDGRLVGIVAQAISYILEREFGVQTIREYLEQKNGAK